MNNRDNFTSRLLFFSSDTAKLALRNVCLDWRSSLKKHIVAPYKDKVDFVLGVGGMFYDKAHLEVAWRVYHNTTTSKSLKPAMLYKLTDMTRFKIDGTYDAFLQGEYGGITGRVYSPGDMHAWDVNQVWLLAQLHHARPFVIYSELNDQNKMRRNQPTVYSAFTKEVSTAIKAGYTISITDNNRIQLNSDSDKPIQQQLTIDDIQVNAHDNNLAVNNVTDAKLINKKAIKCAKMFKALFEEIETYNHDELVQFQQSTKSTVSDILDNLFTDCSMKKLALTSFLNEYNINQPLYMSRIQHRESKSYFDPTLIDKLNFKIKSQLDARVAERIKYSERKPGLNGITYK